MLRVVCVEGVEDVQHEDGGTLGGADSGLKAGVVSQQPSAATSYEPDSRHA